MDQDFFDMGTICPRSSDPFYIVSYYIKWVTASWTHSIMLARGTWRGSIKVASSNKKPKKIRDIDTDHYETLH